jgi:hypothetical protein
MKQILREFSETVFQAAAKTLVHLGVLHHRQVWSFEIRKHITAKRLRNRVI